MNLQARKIIDRAFSAVSVASIILMALVLVILLGPVFLRGLDAFFFRGTVEHRKLMLDQFDRGSAEAVNREYEESKREREGIFNAILSYEPEARGEVGLLRKRFDYGETALKEINPKKAKAVSDDVAATFDNYIRKITEQQAGVEKKDEEVAWAMGKLKKNRDRILKDGRETFLDRIDAVESARLEGFIMEMESSMTLPLDRLVALKEILRELLGPFPGDAEAVLMRQNYGQTRWDRALVKFDRFKYLERWVDDGSGSGILTMKKFPRKEEFAGTSLEKMFEEFDEQKLESILKPEFTFYYGFVLDESFDEHVFGGIWPEVLGTLALTIGAMLFAIPMGIISAIYLAEYARDSWSVGFLRSCISTLAGVPSIVFGLFGLAFFIDTLKVSESRSLLAGSLTLSLLVLPTIIRAAEEAILSVPRTYKEAAMGLGATRWRTVVTVILPAALPGILTGIVISMGRAAGETAPIIFTAAVSLGAPLALSTDAIFSSTPALPWNIYNLCSENASVEEIRHVQYGMVLTLVGMVLMLNAAAVILRARIQKKMRG